MDIPQEEKAKLLEQAVINSTEEEILKICSELGYIEMSAPALGLACRYRGTEAVKALVQSGVTFDFPSVKEIEKKYRCYIGEKYRNYRTNYSLYLLKIFRGEMKGACCTKGMSFLKQAARKEGKPIPFLPDNERIKVLDFLYENREKISFDPEEMLYYAIFAKDEVIVSELKKFGVGLSKERIKTITEGGYYSNGYWYEFLRMSNCLTDSDYLSVMKKIFLELEGKSFHFTDKVYEITKKRFSDINAFKFFFANFRRDKMNKSQIIRDLISLNNAEALPIVEKEGWLGIPKKRDDYIKFASDNGNPEAVSWLLDFKNRTADFAAEQEKNEKKMLAELNADPNSVKMLQKIWSYKKLEDGTLIITNYKGIGKTEVTVPEKIGKSIVTAIGNGAFTTASGISDGTINISANQEQIKSRRRITKIILPKTLKYIGPGAFAYMWSLEDIQIPEGVEKIDKCAFERCDALISVTIPGTVKKIGAYAYANCGNLRHVKICEGVLEIGAGAFHDDLKLKEVELPGSLQRLITETLRYNTIDVFDSFLNLTVHCPKGSYAESYCKKHIIKVVYTSEEV